MKIVVRKGDSLWYYSQLFRIPLSVLQASNMTLQPLQLDAGQAVNIPGYATRTYIVQQQDTLSDIAKNYQVPVDMLQLANKNVDPDSITPKQQLYIPYLVKDRIIHDPDRYTYAKLQKDLQRLITLYPFIFRRSIGKSVLSKDIFELKIGSGPKQRHINGSFHANEWITTSVIMRFLNDYALALTTNQAIRELQLLPFFQSVTLSIVPMVNPDGVDLVLNGADAAEDWKDYVLDLNDGNVDFSNWKANIKGVDLNNQFPAKWDLEQVRKPAEPAPRDFPGFEPLTEPEAITMANLAGAGEFDMLNCMHTQGEEIYWGFEGREPTDSERIVEEFERTSGYKAIRYVDSYAGYKDWYIYHFRKPGFTFELGEGVNPLPISQFEEIYEETLGIMLATLYM
ncbi:g-D-glutamyl-meso-diaminopimelate peptidase [Gracilibacillus halotolerans]|uniref:G-D-glutamyl-meso-diaminopimelate peptidase n=1 Tax=Gracilibacillus halotolerans TaxID=74386 RepID=A0A841RL06_9BACI|nr:M14 family metallopeptidase [Gracilibacillus halotolerans]MBB6512146.1 g-D-glutamyl-meso-diaminopimelate peptidase [Gracilibacillus halotolerans]